MFQSGSEGLGLREGEEELDDEVEVEDEEARYRKVFSEAAEEEAVT